MRLIYDNDGVASVVTPTPKFLAQLKGPLDENGDDTNTSVAMDRDV